MCVGWQNDFFRSDGFDFETGKYNDFSIRYKKFCADGNTILYKHPDTGVKWKGEGLPNWEYVKDMMPALAAAKKERVFITHSGCTQEVINAVRTQLEELGHFEEILITRAGSVITSHCGPGTLGVLYIAG